MSCSGNGAAWTNKDTARQREAGLCRGHLLTGTPRAQAGLTHTAAAEGRPEPCSDLCTFREFLKETEAGSTVPREAIRADPTLLMVYVSSS